MLEVKFQSPTEEHVASLIETIRQADLDECISAGYAGASDAVRSSVTASTECWSCTVDGEVIAIFGVVLDSALEGKGSLWLLTSKLVERNPKTFVKYSKLALEAMRSRWSQMYVGIDAHYSSAIRFAARLGFTSAATYANPKTGEPFRLHVIGG